MTPGIGTDRRDRDPFDREPAAIQLDDADVERARLEAIAAGSALIGFSTAVTDEFGHVLHADPAACALLGVTEAELIALPDFVACMAPEERSASIAARARRRGTERVPYRREMTLLHSNGDRIPVGIALVPMRWHDGRRANLLLIDDRRPRQRREALVERYARLVEAMPICVVIWDTEGITDPMQIPLVSANPAANHAFGFDVAARVGETVHQIFPQSHRFDDAARTLAMRGTGRTEYFADLIVGDRGNPRAVYRRSAVALTGGAVAHLLEDVTRERAETQRRRKMLERLVDAGDEERRNLAMGVHDDPVQQIAAATLLVEALRRTPSTPQRGDRMATIETSLRSAMASLRRLVFELSPPELFESGLEAALRSASDYLFTDTDVHVAIELDLAAEPDPAVQTAVFRIAAEALTNVRKHADAATVTVRVQVIGGFLDLVVTDDGSGFDGASVPGHIGLRNMRERATSLGGRFELTSSPEGTTVAVAIPIHGRAGVDDRAPIAAESADLLAVDIESLRRERRSLVDANTLERHRADRAEALVGGLVSIWSVLDDPGLDRDGVLAAGARVIAEVLNDGCAIRLVSADGQRLVRVASWHPDRSQHDFLDRYVFVDRPRGDSMVSVAYVANQGVIVESSDVIWANESEDRPPAPYEPHSAAVVPIRTLRGTVGALTVVRDVTEAVFSAADLPLVQSIADGVGRALDRHG